MNISLDEVESVLLQRKVPNATEILKDLEQVLEELKAEKEANKEEKPKYEFIVILNDPNGELKDKKVEDTITAFVVQQEEGEDATLVFSKIEDAARAQNETAKTKKSRLQSMRDIFDGLKSKFLKEKKLKIKTKEPVRVLLSTKAL